MKYLKYVLVVVGVVIIGVIFSLIKPAEQGAGITTKSSFSANNGTFTGNTAITGTETVTGNFTANGTKNIVNGLFPTGVVDLISTTSATYTLSPTDVNSSYIQFTPLGAQTTVTFPATSTLFASYLTTIGQSKKIYYESAATSTILVAGSGGSTNYSSTTTIAANKHAVIDIVRDTATTYDMFITNILN